MGCDARERVRRHCDRVRRGGSSGRARVPGAATCGIDGVELEHAVGPELDAGPVDAVQRRRLVWQKVPSRHRARFGLRSEKPHGAATAASRAKTTPSRQASSPDREPLVEHQRVVANSACIVLQRRSGEGRVRLGECRQRAEAVGHVPRRLEALPALLPGRLVALAVVEAEHPQCQVGERAASGRPGVGRIVPAT